MRPAGTREASEDGSPRGLTAPETGDAAVAAHPGAPAGGDRGRRLRRRRDRRGRARRPRRPQRFLDAWERGDTEAMYAELTPEAQEEYSLERFQRTYEEAATRGDDRRARRPARSPSTTTSPVAPVALATHIFGELGGELELPISDDLVDWTPEPRLPGLERRRAAQPPHPGARRARRSWPPTGPRSPKGPAVGAHRSSTAALAVVGEVGAPSRDQERELAEARLPARHARPGTSGLELAFNERLAGRPGGQLLAVGADEESDARRRARARHQRAGRAARRCGRTSTPSCSRPRSRRSAASTAAPRCSTRATARCWRSPGSPTRRRSRPARPSR